MSQSARRYCVASIFTAVLMLLGRPGPAHAAPTWAESFESYAVGSFPSPPWANSGNSDAKIDDQVHFTGQHSFRLFGLLASCWAAVAHRTLNASPPFEIEFEVRNGTEALSGCHPNRGGVGLNTGASWTTQGRELLQFSSTGEIRSGASGQDSQGILLGTYLPDVWYKVKIRYEIADAQTVQLTYWIDDEFRGRQDLSSQSFEASLAYLSLAADEGTAWFDDVNVTRWQSPGAELLGLSPRQGGNAGSVTVTIAASGLDLSSPPQVKLVKTGEAPILGQAVTVDHGNLVAQLDLTGRTAGLWDLAVVDAAGKDLHLADAFTIEQGNPAVWTDSFESYATGVFPKPSWTSSGNSDAKIDAQVHVTGQHSFRLFGLLGSCWGALAHRALGTPPPFEIELEVRNGHEGLSGCHPNHGVVGLNTGPSWTAPGRGLLQFNGKGEIRGGASPDNPGALLGTYLPDVWYKVRVRYEIADSKTVQLSYWIDDEFRGRQALPSQSFESSLAYIALDADEGTAWFDDVKVTHLQSLGAELLGLSPHQGGNAGSVTVTIVTSGLVLSGSPQVKLTKAGETPIVGQGVTVDRENLIARLDLTGRAVGPWDLTVVDAAGKEISLPGAFTVELGGSAAPWLDILGPTRIRLGREQTFTILYGNRGNIDANGVPVWIEGIPATATWHLDFDLATPPAEPGVPDIDWTKVPVSLMRGGQVSVPLLIPLIAPGSTGFLRISLVPQSRDPIGLRAWAAPPLFDRSASTAECLDAFTGLALNLAHLLPGEECVVDAASYILALENIADKRRPYSLLQGFVAGGNTVLHCLDIVLPERKLVELFIKGFDTGLSLVEVTDKCTQTFLKAAEAITQLIIVTSADPNAKIGSRGSGDRQYMAAGEPLRYAILFENLETASAPAQEVAVTDPLDVHAVDLDTLSLGPISFGKYSILPPAGRSVFDGEVDLRPDRQLIVRIHAALDRVSGLLTWRLTSIDPTTGLPPTDPLAGFLPPDVHPPEGAGSVVFTVMPAKSLATGATVLNRASIIFDANPAISTADWLNTLDATPPLSRVLPLAPTQSSASFEVRWSGSDGEAGIKDFNISVSQDGGPWHDWLVDTPASSSIFTGQAGSSYSFRSAGRDLTSNREPVHTTADATTRVQAEAKSCSPGPANLCLDGNRFRVDVAWKDFAGHEGVGQVVPFGSDDSGLFWFFDPQNWEMLVKVLDGCGLNQHFWVFGAATTTVQYTLRIADTATGTVREYVNPAGKAAASIVDTSAFSSCVPASTAAKEMKLVPLAPASPARSLDAQVGCAPSSDHLCLGPGRFRVEVAWKDFQGHTGAGQVVPFGSDDSGLLWFFGPQNWEMLVKVLDGCKLNQHFWVFSAATTTVEYTLRVTDTRSGVVKEYFNPLGTVAVAITDTGAFGTCP